MVGEPSLKLLRYQQQFSFFDSAKVGTSVRYVNLTHATLEHGLGAVLDAIVAEGERVSLGVVVVDWVNRAQAPTERLGFPPDLIVPDISALAALT